MQGKHKGSKFEYEEQRNQNLLKVYRKVMAVADYSTLQPDIFKLVVMSESERFWVSEERADAVLCKMLRNGHAALKNMYPLKRKMYKEIFERTMEMMKENPKMTRMEAISVVLAGPAPEFYLTPCSARVILCKAKQKWYQERKQKLRHLF